MKIISRYVLREHLGPLMFAFTTLTSLLLLNFISRQFRELVGKGLPWPVIGEFFMLSIPFTVALTVPMSVLVAVLYAYSRLASENEITAMKANGVSPLRLVMPAIGFGIFMSIALLAFNDQVLPRANHRLKTLQDDISQTKPTLLLKDQVINPIAEGKFYLKAGRIDRTDSGRMKQVVIYDLADPMRRRTIFADSGIIAFSANKVDIDLTLFDGQMQEVATDKPTQLDRLFYKQDRIRIKDVGRELHTSQPSSSSKGDREMSVCEMQRQYWMSNSSYASALRDYQKTAKAPNSAPDAAFSPPLHTPEPHGIGWAYCTLLHGVFGVKEAQAAEVPLGPRRQSPQQAQDSVKRAGAQDSAKKQAAQDSVKQRAMQDSARQKAAQDSAKRRADSANARGGVPAAGAAPFPVLPATQVPAPGAPVPGAVVPPAFAPSSGMGAAPQAAAGADTNLSQEAIAAKAAAELMRLNTPKEDGNQMGKARLLEAKMRLDIAERARNRYAIEIHKKFSLALACLIFCIVAPPIALRFPRGGVGLVIGVSLAVFALYYVGLIGGEALANKAIMPPFWAMWGTNVIMTLVGVVLLLRMGHESGSGRGGGVREWFDNRRARREDAARAR
ncbi:MAG: LptF/LptG family permease [bacterium]